MIIKNKKTVNDLFILQIFIFLYAGIVYSYNNTVGTVLFRLQDIINLLIFLFSLKTISSKQTNSCLIFLLFCVYAIGSITYSNMNLINVITRAKNILYAFLVYYVTQNILTIRTKERIIDYVFKAQIVNLILVLFQSFVAEGIRVDFRNGIFGFYDYVNAKNGYFCLFISVAAMVFYVEKKWDIKKTIFYILISCVICALAEIKVYFVLFVLSLLFIGFVKLTSKKSFKPTIKLFFWGAVALVAGYILLSIFFPYNLSSFKNISNYIAYEQSAQRSGPGRLGQIAYIMKHDFDNSFLNSLFGLGLGSKTNAYVYELSKTFVDLGVIGVILLYGILISNCYFCLGGKKLKYLKGYSLISMIMTFIMAIAIVVWDTTFNNNLYFVFFTLALFNMDLNFVTCEN